MAKGSANAITLPNLGGSASSALKQNANLGSSNLYPGLTPEYSGLAQGIASQPFQGQALQGAQQGANIGANAATGSAGAGNALTGYSQQLLPYATSIMNAGFDPQSTLYNQQFQQNTDQERAAETARGIAMSPYGAGLESQSDINFNTNWENQQLGREATAAGAASGLVGAAGNAATTGLNLGQGASSLAGTAGAMPENAYNQGNQAGMSALSSLGQFGAAGASQSQQQIQNILSYLGLAPQMAQAQTASNDAQNPMMALAPILGQLAGGAAGGAGTGGGLTQMISQLFGLGGLNGINPTQSAELAAGNYG